MWVYKRKKVEKSNKCWFGSIGSTKDSSKTQGGCLLKVAKEGRESGMLKVAQFNGGDDGKSEQTEGLWLKAKESWVGVARLEKQIMV